MQILKECEIFSDFPSWEVRQNCLLYFFCVTYVHSRTRQWHQPTRSLLGIFPPLHKFIVDYFKKSSEKNRLGIHLLALKIYIIKSFFKLSSKHFRFSSRRIPLEIPDNTEKSRRKRHVVQNWMKVSKKSKGPLVEKNIMNIWCAIFVLERSHHSLLHFKNKRLNKSSHRPLDLIFPPWWWDQGHQDRRCAIFYIFHKVFLTSMFSFLKSIIFLILPKLKPPHNNLLLAKFFSRGEKNKKWMYFSPKWKLVRWKGKPLADNNRHYHHNRCAIKIHKKPFSTSSAAFSCS